MKLFSAPLVLGCPFLAPPGVPEDRLHSLRQALSATFRDREFQDETTKAGFIVDNPMDGATLAKVVADMINTPVDVVAKAKAATVDSKKAP
jgi:tripartite-type tricarboxylate transporter receptor subunit TctC